MLRLLRLRRRARRRVLAHLLDATRKVVAHEEILRALPGREKPAELLLLRGEDLRTTLLRVRDHRHVVIDLRLITAIRRGECLAQRLARLTLVFCDVVALRLIPIVDVSQPARLIVRQIQPLFDDAREGFTHLTRETLLTRLTLRLRLRFGVSFGIRFRFPAGLFARRGARIGGPLRRGSLSCPRRAHDNQEAQQQRRPSRCHMSSNEVSPSTRIAIGSDSVAGTARRLSMSFNNTFNWSSFRSPMRVSRLPVAAGWSSSGTTS